MKFKMVIAFLPEERLDEVLEAARKAGATGSTVITSARGEGLEPERRFLGLDVASHRNLVFWLVEEAVAPRLMSDIASAGCFESERGAGIACQIDIEAAVGLMRQIRAIEGGEPNGG
ncbi:MAG: P-II family nitrogen regulator [Rhodobacter sp.]|nr:P-II family nitrogen regulator [Rhodobacter sp.]MCA3558958.1 P-II family nitrogen regulator [Rhodobacter sp.]MCA3702042.1 P-II family nitrogen regulator [Methylobacterium sp.]